MILDLFRKHNEFYNIQGYDDIKDIVRRALDAEENYNLLFIGPPASAKTLFLLGIHDILNGVTNNRVQKFNNHGIFITKWGSPGSGDGQFQFPSHVAVDRSGHVYVTDSGSHTVQVFFGS
jgi:hypothetical protein